jgi:thiamine-phosphate pyrophosphorylase
MTDAPDQPQLCLITPPAFDLETWHATLAACLDAVPVACLRLALAGRDDDRIARAADALRELAHARDIALVIENHALLVERLGLDGVHLTDAARSVRQMRKLLGPDAIVGAFCGNSRHDGMTAGELGADYVSFGPVGESPLDAGRRADDDLFAWWSEMIEVPVIAEGALDAGIVRRLALHADFFGIGEEIWNTDNPVTALRSLHAAMLGGL